MFNEVTSDDRMRELVLSIENAKRDQASREYEAELKGLTKGMEQGKRQGIEQGLLTGKLETAKALLLDGATPEFVVKITKLDISVIENLQKNIT